MSRWRSRVQSGYIEHYSSINSMALEPGVPERLRRDYESNYLPLFKDGRAQYKVLDIGCGTGVLAEWLDSLPGVTCIGVDSSSSQIMAAREIRPGLTFVEADGLEFLKGNKCEFDAIFCNDVLEHLPTLDDTLEFLEASRIALKPDGFIYCRVPNAASLIAAHSLFADITHHRLYTSHTLCQILHIAGFPEVAPSPIRSSRISGRVRLKIEHVMHRLVYWIAGRTFEKVFTRNVSAIGRNSSPRSE